MGVASGFTRLEKYLIIKGFLEKSLKIVSSPEPKAQGELVWDSSRRP